MEKGSVPLKLTNEDVQEIVKILDSSGYDELHLETDSFTLTLRRSRDGDWTREHWYATREERDRMLKEMSERYVYFRPGDRPTLEFEKVDK